MDPSLALAPVPDYELAFDVKANVEVSHYHYSFLRFSLYYTFLHYVSYISINHMTYYHLYQYQSTLLIHCSPSLSPCIPPRPPPLPPSASAPTLYPSTPCTVCPCPQAACSGSEQFEQLASDYGLTSYYDKQAFLEEMRSVKVVMDVLDRKVDRLVNNSPQVTRSPVK